MSERGEEAEETETRKSEEKDKIESESNCVKSPSDSILGPRRLGRGTAAQRGRDAKVFSMVVVVMW